MSRHFDSNRKKVDSVVTTVFLIILTTSSGERAAIWLNIWSKVTRKCRQMIITTAEFRINPDPIRNRIHTKMFPQKTSYDLLDSYKRTFFCFFFETILTCLVPQFGPNPLTHLFPDPIRVRNTDKSQGLWIMNVATLTALPRPYS
jgi:hypothetical protein